MKKVRVDIDPRALRELLAYSPETGLLHWLPNPNRMKEWNTRHAGKVAGCLNKRGDVHVRVEGHLYLGARVAWALMTGEWPTDEIDHKDGMPSNNRWANLRAATHAENMRNKAVQRNSTNGLRGVRYRPHHKKWEARITINRKAVWHGYYASAQEAVVARHEALPRFHGEFVRET